jgi:hypothetical protein
MISLLVLSLYHPQEHYDQMLANTNQYLDATLKDFTIHDSKIQIDYWFITLAEMEDEYRLDESTRIFTISGKESMIPGILHKTLRAMEILMERRMENGQPFYDYILRTTVATCVDIPRLYTYLTTLDTAQNYYIGNLQTLAWIDVGCGIVDQTYWGTMYSGGGFTLYSKEIALEMMRGQKDDTRMIHHVVDDLAIGYFIQSMGQVQYINLTHLAEFYGRFHPNKVVFFNNTNKHQRTIDVQNHATILSHLGGTKVV